MGLSVGKDQTSGQLQLFFRDLDILVTGVEMSLAKC